MRMKRRHKVILIFGVFATLIAFGLPYLSGVNAGEQDANLWFMFSTWWIGFWTGIIIYSGGLDAEEREKAEWKFQDNVYMMYEDFRVNKRDEEEAINQTAIYYDTSPSNVRSIVKIYEVE